MIHVCAMRKAGVASILLVLRLAIAVIAEAQQPAKLAKIGWLGVAAPRSRIELFREAFREIGYVEGKNIAITVRSANGRLEQLPVLIVPISS